MERIRGTAVIIKGAKIALIWRVRKDRKYYCFPGGGVEKGETPEQATKREIKEELNLDIDVGPLLWEFQDERHYGLYFQGLNPEGELKLGGPEAKRQKKDNIHIPKWVPLNKLAQITLYPVEIKQKVIDKFLKN